MQDTLTYHKDNTKWHYIDLDEFEYKIRMDERQQSINSHRNLRRNKSQQRMEKIQKSKYLIIQKLIGLFVILITVLSGIVINGIDMSFAFITIPIGILLLFSKSKCLMIGNDTEMIHNK